MQDARYWVARAVAVILWCLGAVWLVLGIVVISKTRSAVVGGPVEGVFVSIEIAGTILGCALFAFCAAVLQVLTGVWDGSLG